MPTVLGVARFDDSGGIGETLRKYEAQYHQSRPLCLTTMITTYVDFQSNNLEKEAPYLAGEFQSGHFVIHKLS